MKQQYLRHQINIVAPFLGRSRTILDFGCGDLSLSQKLVFRDQRLRITAIDVVDTRKPGRTPKNINFLLYDGESIPFPANTFDMVIAYHVFHHCDNPEASFYECVRVVKKRILLIEPVMRSFIEKPGIIFMDILANLWRKKAIPMPGKIYPSKRWLELFYRLNLKIICEKDAGLLPKWLPIGKTVLYVLEKS